MEREIYDLVHSKSISLYDTLGINLYELGKNSDSSLNYFSDVPLLSTVNCRHEVPGYYLSDEGIKAICGVPDYFITKDDIDKILIFIRPTDRYTDKILVSDGVKSRISNILDEIGRKEVTITDLDPVHSECINKDLTIYEKKYNRGNKIKSFYIKA